MAHSGEVLGGLFYGHSEVDVFQQEAEDWVAAVAAQAAVGIENFRLREQLNRKIADLEKAEEVSRRTGQDAAVLAAIVASSEDAIISKDLTGKIMSWNDAAARLFGYSAEEIVGCSILKLIPEELHAEETTILRKVRAGERIEHFETVRMKKNGERMDVSLSISPVRDETGTVVGASKILRDISHRKQLEKSIIQAEKIAATGRMAATIAHEINNPLEAVVNLLYLVRTSADNAEEVKQYVAIAEGEVARVSHIARQTLGYYRENTAAVEADISELAANAIAVYAPRCRSAEIQIAGRLKATKKIVLRTGELMQVISNLIANAIYAMPQGGVLTIRTEDVEGGVVLSIEDTGMGIPADKLSRVFDAFYTTRGAFGTGIGLFVTKQFVEGHGGRISVESRTEGEQRGTRLAIFLPEKNPYAGED
jgi:PAS domain S-box-containing protein